MTYLKYALQPYGTVIALAEIAGEQAMKVRLDPVAFAPGKAELESERFEYLERIAKIINERPEITVKVCGVAVEADRAALAKAGAPVGKGEAAQGKKTEPAPVTDKVLLKLADQRADNVEDHLVTQHKVSSSRLVS